MADPPDDWIEIEEEEIPLYTRRVIRLGWAATIASFAFAALGLIGEWLDWWDAFGELATGAGSVAGLLLGLLTAFGGATAHQVKAVRAGVRMTNANLHGMSRSLRSVDTKLDKLDELDVITAHLNQQTGILVQIRDRL